MAGWRPTVQASASYGFSHERTEVPTLKRTERLNPFSSTLQVSQPLYRGGRTVANTERAVFQIQSQRAQVFVIEQQVLLGSVQAYMNLYRGLAVVQLNANNIEVLKRQLEAAQDRFRVGEVTRTDVAQAESRLARAVADKRQADGNVEVARATFERVSGLVPIDITFPKRVPKTPPTREEAKRMAEQNNPQIVAARFSELGARANVRSITGELLPTVSLDATGTYNDESQNANTKIRQGTIAARVSVPSMRAARPTPGSARPSRPPASVASRSRPTAAASSSSPARAGTRCSRPAPRSRRCARTSARPRSRWMACSRKPPSARARCSTSSTPSRSCSTPASTSSARSATSWSASTT